MASANGVELSPSRCSAVSPCLPKRPPFCGRLWGRGQQVGSSARATDSSRPRLDQPSMFTLPPRGLCRDFAGLVPRVMPLPEETTWASLPGQMASLVPRVFLLFPKQSPSDTSQFSCNLIPGWFQAKSHQLPPSNSKLGTHAHVPRGKDSPYIHTHRHPHPSAKPLSGGAKRAWIQQPLPRGSILWCRPGGKAVPERP